LWGAVTGRGDAITLRLSMVYALADGSAVIQRPHLKAAYAVWQFCCESARYLFGEDEPVSALEAKVLALVRNKPGISRKEMYDAFNRNVSMKDIAYALSTLRAKRLLYDAKGASTGKGGRPAERWYPGAEERPNAETPKHAETSQPGSTPKHAETQAGSSGVGLGVGDTPKPDFPNLGANNGLPSDSEVSAFGRVSAYSANGEAVVTPDAQTPEHAQTSQAGAGTPNACEPPAPASQAEPHQHCPAKAEAEAAARRAQEREAAIWAKRMRECEALEAAWAKAEAKRPPKPTRPPEADPDAELPEAEFQAALAALKPEKAAAGSDAR
jgi:hypothetical protein